MQSYLKLFILLSFAFARLGAVAIPQLSGLDTYSKVHAPPVVVVQDTRASASADSGAKRGALDALLFLQVCELTSRTPNFVWAREALYQAKGCSLRPRCRSPPV